MLKSRLKDAISDKRALVDGSVVTNSNGVTNGWAFVSFFRYLSLIQIDESWCKHLTRLDLLKEEMVLQSFTAERDVMDSYREKASTIFSSLMDVVRRNTVYSLFIYKPTQVQ